MRGSDPSRPRRIFACPCSVRAGAKRGLPLSARPQQQQQQQPDKVLTGPRCADTSRGAPSPRAAVTVRVHSRPRALLSPAPVVSAGMSARSRAVHRLLSFVLSRPRRRCSRACVSVPGTAEQRVREPARGPLTVHPVAMSVSSFTDGRLSCGHLADIAILSPSRAAGRRSAI